MVDFQSKDYIRKKFLKIRESYNPTDKEIKDITNNLLNVVKKYNADTILLYYPHKKEVNTIPIIEKLIKLKKTVLLPKVEKDNILPIIISNISNLKVGFAGIKEPEGFTFPKEKIDIVVVPAIAYDKRGYRLGYGKGFYDRFLKDFQNLKIGLAYDFQVVDKLPNDTFDIPVDIIITPKEVIYTGK